MKRILIEDDASLRETLQLFLQVEGFVIQVAANLAQAEQHLNNSPVDILLLDLGLQEEDGLEWLQRKRTQLGQKKVLSF